MVCKTHYLSRIAKSLNDSMSGKFCTTILDLDIYQMALWPLSHTAKGSVSFSASHQTTIALPLVLADNKSRQAGALNSIEDESI